MTGGGYALTTYAPIFPNNDSNAPDTSQPFGANAWSVWAGGAPGGTCFHAFAVCVK